MKCAINTVLELETNKKTIKVRIIWIKPQADILYYIRMYVNRAMPKKFSLSQMEQMIDDGAALIIKDPYANKINESDLSKQNIETRDKYYEIVSELWDENKEILIKSKRQKIIEEVTEKYQISKSTLERLLYRFWS